MALNYEKMAAEGNKIINDLALELGDVNNRDRASRVLKATLQGLRNRLVPDEAMDFASQLPMALKGIMVEGYKVSNTPKEIDTVQEFINEVRLMDKLNAENDFGDNEEAERAISAVFHVLRNYISEGQMEHVENLLPKELKQIVHYE